MCKTWEEAMCEGRESMDAWLREEMKELLAKELQQNKGEDSSA